MARKRRPVAKSKREASAEQDPLGKLLKVYRPHVGGCLIVSGLGFIVAVLCVAFALFLSGHTVVVGIAGLVAALIFLGTLYYSATNYRQRLEFHKGGLRFTKGRDTIEIVWHDIVDIRVARSNVVGYGPVRTLTRSEDAEQEEGMLTDYLSRSFWELTVVDMNGRTIYLNQMFMHCIRNPRNLVQNIRKGSGLQPGEVRRF